MRSDPVNEGYPRAGQPSRREILKAAAAALAVRAVPALGTSDPATQPAPTSAPANQPWWLGSAYARSRVVDARSPRVLSSSLVNPEVLTELLDASLNALMGTSEASVAWQRVLGPARRIAIKFNSVGSEMIGTTPTVARRLVAALGRAGYAPDGLMLVEAPEFLRVELGTGAVPVGWGESIPLGGGSEPLAAWLLEADAVINVPFLKTHRLAGFAGALKNLAYGAIRSPARYHANGCSPFVGQIVGSPAVAGRLRLSVVDATRMVVRNGPSPSSEEDIHGYGGLVVGSDPIGVDSVGLNLLEFERRRLGMSDRLKVSYLPQAAADGLGRPRPPELERVILDV